MAEVKLGIRLSCWGNQEVMIRWCMGQPGICTKSGFLTNKEFLPQEAERIRLILKGPPLPACSYSERDLTRISLLLSILSRVPQTEEAFDKWATTVANNPRSTA